MNLEDFKSFCRVLIPSEVGSIPTHSRHSPRRAGARVRRRALTGLLLLAAMTSAAAAEPAPGDSAGTREPATPSAEPEGTELEEAKTAISPGPLERAFRSALFPAWGQLTNGRPRKAVVLFAVQSYIYTRLVLETRRAWAAQERADRLAPGGDDPGTLSEWQAAEASAQDHFGRRRDLLFWALVGGFYGALDAYIDAHLGDFQEELERDRALFGGIDPAQGTLELGLRF